MTAIQPAAPLAAPAAPTDVDSERIAVLTRGIVGGGVQKMSLHVAGELASRGWSVDLLSRRAGPADAIPAGVRATVLAKRLGLAGRRLAWVAEPRGRALLARPVLGCLIAAEPLRYLPALVDHLRRHRPRALVSATTYLNLVAIWARDLASPGTRVLVSERDSLSTNLATGRSRRAWRWRHAPPLLRHVYPRAEAIVAVSDGVADDLAEVTGLPRSSVRTVYNPVVNETLLAGASADPGEPWLASGSPPAIVSAGRLVAKKQFEVLVAAFARLRRERDVRLLIYGEGPERRRIEQAAERHGVADSVRLAGWCPDLAPVLQRAAAFALTSNREGFGNVLVEALACGCPVVATDCPSGPSEILGGGAFGELAPVGDVAAIAAALARTLDAPPPRDRLRARGAEFTTRRATDAYLEALGLPLRPERVAAGRPEAASACAAGGAA